MLFLSFPCGVLGIIGVAVDEVGCREVVLNAGIITGVGVTSIDEGIPGVADDVGISPRKL